MDDLVVHDGHERMTASKCLRQLAADDRDNPTVDLTEEVRRE